jgi:4-aminobutyrate aminotransferase-like enzyme
MNPHLQLLRDYESRNVTHLAEDGSWPIVWERAKSVHVWDTDGKKYLDLTAAFAVAATGHANPRVTKAAQAQLAKLPHAMGDVHPHPLKGQLARELSKLTFERWKLGRGKTIFCNSGFEAVEAALKTALLATGKKGVIAFEGAYHGLGYGALTTTHREHFRNPFKKQLGKFSHFAPFGENVPTLKQSAKVLKQLFKDHSIGAVLVEPIQGRAGMRSAQSGFLKLLRQQCDKHNAILIFDEILTGFGRTGNWFTCEDESVFPDLICLGKALTNGFPLSVCVGKAEVMDRAWSKSEGEAIHTSTFLGHPVGCAMALAQLRELKEKKLITQASRIGKKLEKLCQRFPIRGARFVGKGLMAGLAFDESEGPRVFAVVKDMLRRGYILLPAGEHGNVIALTPAFTITEKQLERTLRALQSSFAKS